MITINLDFLETHEQASCDKHFLCFSCRLQLHWYSDKNVCKFCVSFSIIKLLKMTEPAYNQHENRNNYNIRITITLLVYTNSFYKHTKHSLGKHGNWLWGHWRRHSVNDYKRAKVMSYDCSNSISLT